MKKMLVILLVLVALALLVGCSSEKVVATAPASDVNSAMDADVTTAVNPGESETGEFDEDSAPELSESLEDSDFSETFEGAKGPEPEAEEDPLKILRTTQEIAARHEGIYLMKEDRFYVLNSYFEEPTPGIEYPSHVTWDGAIHLVGAKLHFYNGFPRGRIISMGEVPIPSVRKNDDNIIVYRESEAPDLRLCPILIEAPMIYAVELSEGLMVCNFADLTKVRISLDNLSNAKIIDEEGNELPCDGEESFMGLEVGKKYTVCWYEGTSYHEFESKADSFYFERDETAPFVIKAELTKEGYAKYDLSGMPSGRYCVDTSSATNYFVIDITD